MPVVALEPGTLDGRRTMFRRGAGKLRVEELRAGHGHYLEQSVGRGQHHFEIAQADPHVLGAVLPLVVRHHVVAGRFGRGLRGRDCHRGGGHQRQQAAAPEQVTAHGCSRRMYMTADLRYGVQMCRSRKIIVKYNIMLSAKSGAANVWRSAREIWSGRYTPDVGLCELDRGGQLQGQSAVSSAVTGHGGQHGNEAETVAKRRGGRGGEGSKRRTRISAEISQNV